MKEKLLASLALLAVCVGVIMINWEVVFPESHGTSISFALSSVKSDDTEEQKWRKAEVAAEKYAQAHGGFEFRPVRVKIHGERFPTLAVLVRIKGQDLIFFPDGNFRRY